MWRTPTLAMMAWSLCNVTGQWHGCIFRKCGALCGKTLVTSAVPAKRISNTNRNVFVLVLRQLLMKQPSSRLNRALLCPCDVTNCGLGVKPGECQYNSWREYTGSDRCHRFNDTLKRDQPDYVITRALSTLLTVCTCKPLITMISLYEWPAV